MPAQTHTTAPPPQPSLVRFRAASPSDAPAIGRLVRDSGVVDPNSRYCDLLLCRDFADICVVACVGEGMPRIGQLEGQQRVQRPADGTHVQCVGATPEDHFEESLKKQEYGVPSREAMCQLVERGGITAPKSPAGRGRRARVPVRRRSHPHQEKLSINKESIP